MRIRELHLIRYGKFTDRRVTLPRAPRDIHLIVGPNEAGKSTVRNAIGDWLFGIPARTSMAFLHPMPELRLGGVLEDLAAASGDPAATTAAKTLAFERRKGNKDTLRTPADAPLPDSALAPWLGGLDATAFNRMHALDHDTLVAGGAGILSASDDLGRLLFQSASGLEHLGRVLQGLQDEADALWAPRKSGARAYYVAHEAFEQANAELKHATLRTRDWKAQHDALQECAHALDAAKAQHVQIRTRLDRLQRIRRVQPLLLALDGAQAALAQLLASGPVPLLPADAAHTLNSANQALALARADQQRHQDDIAAAQAALAGLHVDHELLALAADINDLNERRLQYRAHRSDILKREEEIRLEWQRAQDRASGLGWTCATVDEMTRRVPARSIRARLARLLKTRAALTTQRKAAADNLAKREEDIRILTDKLQGLGAASVDTRLQAAVEQALKLGDHEGALSECNAQIQQLDEDLETALAALGAWRVPPAALAAMTVPDPALVQDLLNQQRSDQADDKALRAALEAKQAEHAQVQLALEQFVRTFQPVSAEQVSAARHRRDTLWREISAAPQALPSLAPRFEHEVMQADALSDLRLDKARHEAERQAKAQRLERLAQERDALQAQLQALLQQTRARQAGWLELAQASGLPQLPLELAPVWLEQRRRVLELQREHHETVRQRAARTAAIASATQAIQAALGQADAAPAPALADCLRAARAQLTLAEQARGQRKTLDAQLLEAQASLAALSNARDTANAAWDDWERSWLDAVQAAAYPAGVFADRVEAELDVIDEIDQLLAKMRAIQSERIDKMQADLDQFAHDAGALAQRLLPEQALAQPEDISLELLGRLDQARRAEADWKKCQAALTAARAGLDQALATVRTVEAQLAPLLLAAGVDAPAALPAAIAQSERRRELDSLVAAKHAELIAAADGLAEAPLRAEVAEQDIATLLPELEQLNQQAEDVLEQVAQLSNRHGTLKAAFDAFTGTDLAATAEARKQEANAQMADAVEHYLRLRTQARLLKWSMERFRATRQGPMLAKASAIFRTLTRASFARLVVDADGQTPRLFGVRPAGEQVDVTGMSEGSRDQLYLALRLAALEMQIDQGFNMPLIADDLFINFDDARTAAGMEVLGELSQRMQVVFLTHHDHLVPLAREVLGDGVNVVGL